MQFKGENKKKKLEKEKKSRVNVYKSTCP